MNTIKVSDVFNIVLLRLGQLKKYKEMNLILLIMERYTVGNYNPLSKTERCAIGFKTKSSFHKSLEYLRDMGIMIEKEGKFFFNNLMIAYDEEIDLDFDKELAKSISAMIKDKARIESYNTGEPITNKLFEILWNESK